MDRKAQATAILNSVNSSGQHYRDSLPMIASENILSPLVAKAVNSDLHGRYAEGLPGKRYYQGCEDFDSIESLGIESAKRVFNCNFTNIQSTSGTVSNIATLKALVKPGETITAVSTADGGHISHARMGAVGVRGLNLVTYPWDIDRMEPDIDASIKMIRETKPNLALFALCSLATSQEKVWHQLQRGIRAASHTRCGCEVVERYVLALAFFILF